MPLYDYKCKKCGYIFEVEQRMTDPKLKYCPECKGAVERLISPVGIIFKGSGFHVTDYKKDKSVLSAPKKEKPETKAEKKETKPTPENS
ncbi:MAG: zinc ribbon domain-containing protein [Candidatus Margulisbacteria bacterium]|nr:zinc ribbon domain-containing protein [Candidatus Margulisiibacteriota bacterium]MBU1022175.1 zinc ribbon domain-containing protein [Candidatus Margulisiibacteriota bacterium]MBU1729386.1 zinc ribbon domain-containing protein [Candidatus Margulisiibacteriota bacterium]MBU1955659.1 zinc ribbon domain-containing protein [Candidatus Margulisiibacteriota bacterium]